MALELVNFAEYYATQHHTGQSYGDWLPYTAHLRAVASQVVRWLDPEAYAVLEQEQPFCDTEDVLRASAWLHDVMEDCQVTREELTEWFGALVATIVWRVTNEPGENRAARHQATYPKIRKSRWATFLKLCDRIANVEAGGKLEMYRKEMPGFEQALRRPGEFDSMWEHLRTLLSGS